MQVHGRPLSPPNIIFWNVRADTYGYPAAADQKGVMLLSGYSPALMKFILSGEMEEEVAEALDGDGNVVKTRRQVDPREALRRVLNDWRGSALRVPLSRTFQKIMLGALNGRPCTCMPTSWNSCAISSYAVSHAEWSLCA